MFSSGVLLVVVFVNDDLAIRDAVAKSPQSRGYKMFNDFFKAMVIAGNPKLHFRALPFDFAAMVFCWFDGNFHAFVLFSAECVFVLAGFDPVSSANFNLFLFFFGFRPVLAAVGDSGEHLGE
jgi:hypothetical protein